MAESTALERVNPGVGVSLVEGPDPEMAVVYAKRISAEIAKVLEPGNGFSMIKGRKHVTIEGWQTMAAMTGHRCEVEWSRIVESIPVTNNGTFCWEARAVVHDQSGNKVAAGEAMADPSEPGAMEKWAKGGNFSVRSMAQTRAMSRALSSRMRYIVQLAGFSGTPAEEMDGGDGPKAPTARDVAKKRYRMLRDEFNVEGEQLKSAAALAEQLADDLVYTQFVWSAAGGELLAEEGEVVEEGSNSDSEPYEMTPVEENRAIERWTILKEAAGSESAAWEVAKQFDVHKVEDILSEPRWDSIHEFITKEDE